MKFLLSALLTLVSSLEFYRHGYRRFPQHYPRYNRSRGRIGGMRDARSMMRRGYQKRGSGYMANRYGDMHGYVGKDQRLRRMNQRRFGRNLLKGTGKRGMFNGRRINRGLYDKRGDRRMNRKRIYNRDNYNKGFQMDRHRMGKNRKRHDENQRRQRNNRNRAINRRTNRGKSTNMRLNKNDSFTTRNNTLSFDHNSKTYDTSDHQGFDRSNNVMDQNKRRHHSDLATRMGARGKKLIAMIIHDKQQLMPI
jgi:hypothetical protein